MQCPFCNHNESSVIESRLAEDNTAIRRRRQCINCDKRFTTYERVREEKLLVIKQDKSQELFSLDKLSGGIKKALDKRPVTPLQIDQAISNITRKIKQEYKNTVLSTHIGKIILSQLLNLDKVAYVRFACVHRKFEDANELLTELKKVL